MSIETIEEIDNFFKNIKNVSKYNDKYDKYIIFFNDFTKIVFTDENVSYIFDKISSLSDPCRSIFGVIILNPTFKLEFIINHPELNWNFFNFDVMKFDKAFILDNIDKNWDFSKIFAYKILTFEEIIFNLNNDNFAYRCCRFLNFLLEYEDFDMGILHNQYIRDNIHEYIDYIYIYTKFCEHCKFDFVYVHQYPDLEWNWKILSLRGDMTIGEANKILGFIDNKNDNVFNERKNAKSLMKYFDNLMLQPWMNSWFIKTHVKDEEDRRFYLRKLNSSCYEGRSRKKNELLWRELLDKAMSPERLFYWYLDNYELDNLFTGLLPDDHPRAKSEYQIRPGIYPSERLIF